MCRKKVVFVITVQQYFGSKFGHPDVTQLRFENALSLLMRVGELLSEARADGVNVDLIDPDTGTEISGSKGGSGDGGFRLQDSKTGAPGSAHKNGEAVDKYDPDNALDTWLDKFDTGTAGNTKLEYHGLFREHGDDTPGWCHIQTRAPKSGKRTFRAK